MPVPLPDRHDYQAFRKTIGRLLKLNRQAAVFRTAKRLMNHWRVIHVVLAIFLLVVIAAHIGPSLYLGYRWVLLAREPDRPRTLNSR